MSGYDQAMLMIAAGAIVMVIASLFNLRSLNKAEREIRERSAPKQ